MKIKPTIVISSYDSLGHPVYSGGGAVAVHEVAKRLLSHYQVMVLSGRYPTSKDRKIDGIHYKYIGSWLGPQISQLVFQMCLPYYVTSLKFDLWIESFTPPFSTALLPLFTKKPIVGWLHMLCGPDMKRKYFLPFDLIEQHGLKIYNFLITTSETLKTKVKAYNPKAIIKVVPNGVNFTKPTLSAKAKHILYLGRIEVNQKGLDLLLEAYKKISLHIQYPLVIAGTGSETELKKLQRLIKKLELTDKVLLAGRVVGEKKAELIQNAVCMVTPSRYETFSLVALEALAAGIPLVSFDIEGLSWIPKNSHLTAKSFDVKDFSRKMQKVIEDKNLRKTLKANANKFSKQYSWDSSADQIYQTVKGSMV